MEIEANFSFQIGVILLLETGFLQFQQSWGLLVLTSPSKLGGGSEHRDVGLCCLKQVGFQAGGNPAWRDLIALVTYVLGPSGGDPTRWCPTPAMNVASVFKRILVSSRGDPTGGNLEVFVFSRAGGCWF